MWKKALTITLALTAMTVGLSAKTHRSNNHTEAAIGGFITGVVLAEMFDDSSANLQLVSRCDDRGYSSRSRHSRDSYYGQHNRDSYRGKRDSWSRYDNSWDRQNRKHYNYNYGRKSHQSYGGGYWGYETRKIWVPGHWDYVRNHHGRTVKVWVDGHYDRRKIKVWIRGDRDRGCY